MDNDHATRSETDSIKVFLVEDSPQVLERLSQMVSEIDRVKVVGHAVTYDTAVHGILSTIPDVVILDIKLADSSGSGIDVLARIKPDMPQIKAIMLSNYTSPKHLEASTKAGADYFLDKSAEFDRIAAILQTLKYARGYA